MTNKTASDIVNDSFDQIFKEVIKSYGDDWFEIVVEVKLYDGLSARKSWRDRERRLESRR